MNLIILTGRIGQIEKKSFEWGSVTKFSIATSKKYTKKDGEKVEETQWHNCESFGTLADIIEKFFDKGNPITVTGELTYDKYEKDGQTRTASKIKVSRFEFPLTSKGSGSQTDKSTSEPQESAQTPQDTTEQPENDLPF